MPKFLTRIVALLLVPCFATDLALAFLSPSPRGSEKVPLLCFQNQAIVTRLAASFADKDRRSIAVTIRSGIHPIIEGISGPLAMIRWDPERYAKYREGRSLVAPALRELVETNIFNFLERGFRVLEIGAGPGQMVKWMLQDPRKRGLDWEETDENPDALGQMHGFPTNKRRVILPDLGVPDESLDALVGLAVLDVLNDDVLEETLIRAHKALKLGGRLFHFLDIYPNHIWDRMIQEGKIPFPVYQPADYVPLRGLNHLIQTGFHLVDAALLRSIVASGGLLSRPRIAKILIPYIEDPLLSEQILRQSKNCNVLDPVIDWLKSFGLIEKTVPSLIDEFNQRLVKIAQSVGFKIEVSQEVQVGGLATRNSVWATLPESANAVVFWHGQRTELFDMNVPPGKVRLLAYASAFRAKKIRQSA